ncbi:hypothetical protein D3C73_1435530 [compost metagenome]
MTWDLTKLINSGIILTVDNHEICPNDKKMLTTIIGATFKRIKEVTREKEEAFESPAKLDQDSQLF